MSSDVMLIILTGAIAMVLLEVIGVKVGAYLIRTFCEDDEDVIEENDNIERTFEEWKRQVEENNIK